MSSRPPLTREEFDRAYDASVLNRQFVEYTDYYAASRSRFWQSLKGIEAMGLPEGTRALDIGGGIMAVLMARLLGFRCSVGDVNARARPDIEALGLDFALVDISRDGVAEAGDFDLVVLTEVIEHIPQPPYLVLGRIAKLLAPGGHLFLTTPNGHRFRNLVYMLLGKEILGIYRYPEEGEALGHQHEYTMKQMLWQVDRAGFDVLDAHYYDDGFMGASRKARLAWKLAKPASLVPYWRNSLMLSLCKRPGASQSDTAA